MREAEAGPVIAWCVGIRAYFEIEARKRSFSRVVQVGIRQKKARSSAGVTGGFTASHLRATDRAATGSRSE